MSVNVALRGLPDAACNVDRVIDASGRVLEGVPMPAFTPGFLWEQMLSDFSSIKVDLCRVTRAGADVLLHFGQAQPSQGIEGALQAQVLQRVTLSEGGAAKLQDLLTDLLREGDAAARGGR